MNYSLGNMLGGGMLGALDVDARAYIAAVRATGVSVSTTQSKAIDEFYKNCKSDGYYTSIKRFFLPIWANASANAIDLIGLTSGTFIGGVTHNSGFVTFNGTTGAFRDNATITSHGSTSSTHHAMALVSDNAGAALDFKRFFGVNDSLDATKEMSVISRTIPRMDSRAFGTTALISSGSIAMSLQEGVILQNKLSTSVGGHVLKLLKTAGLAVDLPSSLVNTNSPAAAKIAWGGLNSQLDVTIEFISASYGAMSVGVSIGDNSLQNTYLSRVKTLWETCTGLTLP